MKRFAVLMMIVMLGGAFTYLLAQGDKERLEKTELRFEASMLEATATLPTLALERVETTLPVIRPMLIATPEAFNRDIDLIDKTFHDYPEKPDEAAPQVELLARTG